MIAERLEKEERKYELIKNHSILGDLNQYITNLIRYMWELPEVVASVIKKADTTELKKNVAPYFVNNFYENILSPYYIEDNLMYVLTLLLKDEINNLSSINQEDIFLNDTPCGCILEELKRKSDIKTFFKTIILNAVEDLELNHSSLKINFEISKLIEDYKQQSKNNNVKDKGYLKINYNNQDSGMDDNDELYKAMKDKKIDQKRRENFNLKYIPNLDKEALKKYTQDYENNKRTYDYFNSKLNDSIKDDNYYSNKCFLDNLYLCEYSEELLLQYQDSFHVAISFINTIIDKILNNFHLLPYSVKCLCKVISILITNKFPSISEHEKNAFIAKFFFGKLLTPILKNPGIEAFINNFILSKNTLNNLKNIISKLNDNYFNNYNSNNSSIYNKRKVLKDIPIPKINKDKKSEIEEKKSKKCPKSIKDIKIKKMNINKNVNALNKQKNNSTNKTNSKKIKNNDNKNCLPLTNDYDRDDYELEINFDDYCKEKLNIIDILKLNNKNKSLNEKKLNLISLKLGKNNKNKNKRLSPDLNFRLSAHKNNAIRNYNKNSNKKKDVNNSCSNLNEKKNKYLRIDDGTGEEIKKNNIENNLFSENNLIDIEKIIDDKFDDLYSIIKRINFSTVLLNNEGIFNVENKVYQNHTQVFNNYYDKFYLKNLSTVKKVNKGSKGKNCSTSTKVNTTSCKKNSYQKEKNDIEEFKLLL